MVLVLRVDWNNIRRLGLCSSTLSFRFSRQSINKAFSGNVGTPFPSPLRTLALSPALGTTLVRCLGNSGNSFEAGCAIVRPFIRREGVAFADWATVTPLWMHTRSWSVVPVTGVLHFFFLENKQKILNLLRVELATVIRSL